MSATREIKKGDVLDVVEESKSDEYPNRHYYFVYGRNGKPTVFYTHEVEVIND